MNVKMRRSISRLSGFSALCLAMTASRGHAQTNLLTNNPGFEAGGSPAHGNGGFSIPGWDCQQYDYNYNSVNVETGDATEGTNGFYIHDGGILTTNAASRAAVTPGKVYEFSFDSKKTRDSETYLFQGVLPTILFYDASGNVVKQVDGNESQLTGTTSWQHFAMRVPAPAGAVSAGVQLFVTAGSYPDQNTTDFLFDNCKLVYKPEAADKVIVRYAPQVLDPGTTKTVKVKYTVTTGRDVAVHLLNGGSDYGEVRLPASEGRGVLTFNYSVPANAPQSNNYQWDVRVLPSGGAWSSPLNEATVSNVFLDETESGSGSFTADNALIQYSGRWNFADPKNPVCYWGGSSVFARFAGTSAQVILSGNSQFYVVIDGVDTTPATQFYVSGSNQTISVASGLTNGVHTLQIIRQDETTSGGVSFQGLILDSGRGLLRPEPLATKRRLETYGDSITSGGVPDPAVATPDPNNDGDYAGNTYHTFWSFAGNELNMDTRAISKGGTGVSGSFVFSYTLLDYYNLLNFDGYTPSNAQVYDFSQWQADAVLVAIGHNDQFRKPSDDAFVSAYQTLVSDIRAKYPNAQIFCTNTTMSGPAPQWKKAFNALDATGDPKVHHQLFAGQGHGGHPRYADHLGMALGAENLNALTDWIENDLNGLDDIGPAAVSTAPGTPSNLAAAAYTRQVVLTWSLAYNVGSYNVYRGTTPGSEDAAPIATGVTALTYTDTTVTDGTTYYYVIKGVNNSVVGTASNEASAKPYDLIIGNGYGLTANFYYGDDTSFSPLNGTPFLTTIDPTVNYNVDGPNYFDSGVPHDDFTAQWKGQVLAPTSGNFVFSTTSDDGSVLYINGALVVNNNNYQGATTVYSSPIALVAGQKYDIEADYYQGAYGGVMQVAWSYPGQSTQIIPQSQLYDLNYMYTPPAAPTNLTASATDQTVILNWTGTSRTTSYSIYRGTTAGGESATPIAMGITATNYADTGLTNGTTYYYVVQSVNAYGNSGSSNEASAMPFKPFVGSGDGLKANFYYGDNTSFTPLTTTPFLTTVDPTVNYNVDGGNYFDATVPHDHFTAQWTGQVLAPVSGSYVFSTTSDDGSVLYLNGALVVNNNNYQGSTTVYSSPITLTAGQKYDIEMDYYQGTGGGLAQLSWSYPAQSTQIIPQTQLYSVIAHAPAAPSGLAAAPGNNQVLLNWNTTPLATSYNVYRGTAAGGESITPLVTGLTAPAFTDATALNGTTYYYTVTGVNAYGESLPSNEASATPSATAGQLYAYESFDYPTGPIGGLNGGTGFANAWANGNSAVISPGLSFKNLQVSGNAMNNNGTNRTFSTNFGAVSETTLYISFLTQVNSAGPTASVLFYSFDGKPLRLGANYGNYGWDYNYNQTGGQSGTYPSTNINLMVYKLTFHDGTTDISLYVDPTPGKAFPDTAEQAIGSIPEKYTFNYMEIQNAGLGLNLDELRFGNSFAAVTPAIVTTVTATGNLALEGVNDLSAISAGAPLGTFHVSFRAPGTTTEIYGRDVTLTTTTGSANGTYSVSGILPGTYDVNIKGAKNLSITKAAVVISATTATVPNILLGAGDSDGNNRVDAADFNNIVGAFGTVYDPTMPNSVTGYDPTVDFNFDGQIDTADFNLLAGEYGNSGS